MNLFWQKVKIVSGQLDPKITTVNLYRMKQKGRIPLKHISPLIKKGEEIGVLFTREELEQTEC